MGVQVLGDPTLGGLVQPFNMGWAVANQALAANTWTNLVFGDSYNSLPPYQRGGINVSPTEIASLPATGLYLVQGQANFASGVGGVKYTRFIFDGNAGVPGMARSSRDNTTADALQVSGMFRLTRGQSIQLSAYSTVATNMTAAATGGVANDGRSWLSASYLGP